MLVYMKILYGMATKDVDMKMIVSPQSITRIWLKIQQIDNNTL